jgi:hypothetical protein
MQLSLSEYGGFKGPGIDCEISMMLAGCPANAMKLMIGVFFTLLFICSPFGD